MLSCPIFGSSLVNGSLGKGKGRPFNEHFDYLLELANVGVFHVNQVLFIVVTLSSPFQTVPRIDLKTQLTGFASARFPFPQYSRKSRFSQSQGFTCGSSGKLVELEMLSPVEAAGRYNSLQPNQLEGLFWIVSPK